MHGSSLYILLLLVHEIIAKKSKKKISREKGNLIGLDLHVLR